MDSNEKRNFQVQTVTCNDNFDVKSWWPHYYKNSLSCESFSQKVPRDKKHPFTISEFNQSDKWRVTRCCNSPQFNRWGPPTFILVVRNKVSRPGKKDDERPLALNDKKVADI
jgi:hypothetical protein